MRCVSLSLLVSLSGHHVLGLFTFVFLLFVVVTQRLAALDRLRAEELRFIAAHTFTQSSVNHSQILRPRISSSTSTVSYPPSPPFSATPSNHTNEDEYSDSEQRSNQTSYSNKRSRTTPVAGPSASPSHTDVMTALRSKVSSPRRHSIARSRSSQSTSPPPQLPAQESRQESRQQTAPLTTSNTSSNNKQQVESSSTTTIVAATTTKKKRKSPSTTSTTNSNEHYTSLAPVSNIRGVKNE